ncbi:MAG TPA: hypothetical protein VN903_17705 [Polyangia bacterium]|nr:hypothetical protein [Polyangia bacterium]
MRAILAYLDRRDRTVDAAEVIEWRYDAGTADYAIYRWPATFAD